MGRLSADFVEYSRRDRSRGEPKQTLGKLFQYALDGVLSFSYKPIRLLGAMGILAASSAFLIAIFFSLKRLFGYEVAFTLRGYPDQPAGRAILIGIALVGEYVARIYDEAKIVLLTSCERYIGKGLTNSNRSSSSSPFNLFSNRSRSTLNA